jgi:hypothetical protein
MESTRILISRHPLPEQIIITGDLCPGDNGILSDFGYGLGWFGSRKSEEYLSEKFLRREWVPEAALRALRYALQEEIDSSERDDSDIRAARIDKLNYELDGIGDAPTGESAITRSHEAFYEFWVEVFGDSPEDQGFDYNPRDAGWLCAIQQRFCECYQALQSADAALV